MNELTDAELLHRAHQRIDCPISWCAGHWLEHGGGGAAPDDWMHAADDEQLSPIASGSIVQFGIDPPAYQITIEHEANASAEDLRNMVAHLRDLAEKLEDRAETLAAIR